MPEQKIINILANIQSWIIVFEGILVFVENVRNVKLHRHKSWVWIEVLIAINALIWTALYGFIELSGTPYTVDIAQITFRPALVVLLALTAASTRLIRRTK